MKTHTGTLTELVDDFATQLEQAWQKRPSLRVVGITGPPGAGKTTVARALSLALQARGGQVQPFAGLAPLDGFHLSNAVLAQLGRQERKGDPDTFDVVGYLLMLDRIKAQSLTVYAPDYNRELHEPIAASHQILPHGIVITEGNYLALPRDEWQLVRESIDILLYLDYPQEVLLRRLIERHVTGGKDTSSATHWVRTVDALNIALVQSSRTRCDLVWNITES